MLRLLLLFCIGIHSTAIANIGPQGFKDYAGEVFVETGTYLGAGIQKALDAGFKTVHSLEIDPRKVKRCRKKFANNKNVHIYLKDSKTQLWEVIAGINKPITFWLDAHKAPDVNRPDIQNCPLMEELEQIKRHPINTHTILIDDLHCCGTLYFDYLELKDIVEKLLEINPHYFIEFVAGGDCGEYPNNILVAIDPHQNIFTNIYDDRVWGVNSEGEGFSGGGSLEQNVVKYVEVVQRFMREHHVKSVVDAGCGDWEFSHLIDWTGIDYIGYDVVHSVIEKVKKKYAAKNIHFVHANMITHDLPPADLLLCKHVLQHLTNDDILAFLPQLKKYKYCIITNEVYPDTLSSDNPDIERGAGHKIDLSQPPFNVEGIKLLTYYIWGAAHQMFLVVNP